MIRSKYFLDSKFYLIRDCIFIVAVVLLSLVLYVNQLGFYSDDWDLLSHFYAAKDQSVLGVFKHTYSELTHTQMRPIQILNLSILYKLFGMSPAGYHWVNALFLTLVAILFYFVLLELGQTRLIALSIPLIYSLLPHYSTNRFWIASFQANLSALLYFLSLYCDLRTQRADSKYIFVWKFFAIIGMAGSALAYEVILPFFLFNLGLVWYQGKRLRKKSYNVLNLKLLFYYSG